MKHHGQKLLAGVIIAIIASIAILISGKCAAQEPAEGIFPLKEGSIYYEKIIVADSISKDNLYKITKSWGVNHFKSQKDVLQADDRETGFIAYKGYFSIFLKPPTIMGVQSGGNWNYWFIMKVFLKDGKVKLLIEDVQLQETTTNKYLPIITYRADTEELFKKGMLGKGWRDKYYTVSVKDNFTKANEQFLETLSSLGNYYKSGKSDFDF